MNKSLNIIAVALAILSIQGCQSNPEPPSYDPLSQWDKDLVREREQRKAFRRPADVNITPDMAAVRYAFVRDVYIEGPRYADLPPLEEIQVFTKQKRSLDTVLKFLARPLDYEITAHPDATLSTLVSINSELKTVDEAIASLELQSETTILFYPESYMIMVYPGDPLSRSRDNQ